MKALLVTSYVHFVPYNYNLLIGKLADCPHIGGLMVVDNRNIALLKTICGITAAGAWRIGLQLTRNAVYSSVVRPWANLYARYDKPVWYTKSLNSRETLTTINGNSFDLIINARTRSIYKSELLNLPPLGCINIHHGLLPDQRGVLCDLWSLVENEPAGFSIHYMTEKLDVGAVLSKVVVSDGTERHFLDYLERSSQLEYRALCDLLEQFARGGIIPTTPNHPSEKLKYRKNPNFSEIQQMK